MKCGLKDGLISILFVIFILPSKGVEIPLLLQTSLALNTPMNFKQFKAAINKLQDLDSFPDADDSRDKLHRIVKKQMATTDFKKNKRSVLSFFNFPESFDQSPGDGTHIKSRGERKTKKEANAFEDSKRSQYLESSQRDDSEISKKFPGKIKNLAKDKRINKRVSMKKNVKKSRLYDDVSAFNSFCTVRDKYKEKKSGIKPYSFEKTLKEKAHEQLGGSLNVKEKPYALSTMKEKLKSTFNEAIGKQTPIKPQELEQETNIFLQTQFSRIPDENDYRYYYECETKPFGLIKLKHKRCPEGQYFSNKYLRCLKRKPYSYEKMKRQAVCSSGKKCDVFDTYEDTEPMNEWLDANQSRIQKVPPEFKPKKIPQLKIYHLCSKRKKKEVLQEKTKNRHADSTYLETKRNLVDVTKGMVKGLRRCRHQPRSFLIRVKEKDGKENQDDGITESDEDEEESDEEDDEEDGEDEDEETEEEVQENTDDEKEEEDDEKPLTYKEGLKEFFKSAKAAVTNRARFEDPTRPEPNVRQKEVSLKSKKSEDSGDSEDKSKKVLVDANIRVDGAIGSALKYILKNKLKGNKDSHVGSFVNDEALICDRGSQDQLDPELLRMYEHLIRNNPRVKRYFLANRVKKGN